jgi:hypothetical protein
MRGLAAGVRTCVHAGIVAVAALVLGACPGQQSKLDGCAGCASTVPPRHTKSASAAAILRITVDMPGGYYR